MGKPSIGELDPSLNETQAEKLGKLTVLKESSKDDIASFIGITSEVYDFSGLEYLPEEWLGDTDEDDLFDIYEKVIDTDPFDPDTDDDGLPDGYEVITLNTDPLEIDTDENGISDADEDFDSDNLSNLGEYQNGTDPFDPDTDEDVFMDGDEVYTYGTDPLNPDTDNDGLLDGEESYDGSIYAKYGVYFDPLNPDTNRNGVLDGDEIFGQSKQQEVETHDEAITEVNVDMNTNGNLERNLTIESMYGIDAMSTNVYAMIGEPFNFTSSTNFESATITFKVDQSKLGDTLFDNLIILWYNEGDQIFEEMPTTHDAVNSTVSTTTTHFSQYMVVDSVKWYENWENSLDQLRKMWSGNTSYQKKLHTIFLIDCSYQMESIDPIDYKSIERGYNGVTADNYSDIINDMANDVNYYQKYYGRRQCDRATICENIINNMGSGDKALVMTFSNTVETRTGWSSNWDYLINGDYLTKGGANETCGIQRVNNDGGQSHLNSAISTALSYTNDSTEDMYRIIVITHSNVGFYYDLSSYDYTNVSLNIVNLGPGSVGSYLESIAVNTGGDVYNAISASDLTYESGGMVYVPEQFIGEDSDGDGIPDIVELYGLKTNGDPINTDPNKKDTDGDGLNDNVELHYAGEQLSSGMNIAQYITSLHSTSDPTKIDTDGDKIPDSYHSDMYMEDDWYAFSDPNPWVSDITEISLKNDFFSIDYEYKGDTPENEDVNWILKNNNKAASYGGYQGWFGDYGYLNDYKVFCNQTVSGDEMHSYGCGIIAVADMFFYLLKGHGNSFSPKWDQLMYLGDGYTHLSFDMYTIYIIWVSDAFYYHPIIKGTVSEYLDGNLVQSINSNRQPDQRAKK